MKLLLISDALSIASIFESKEDKYYFQSIQVDYLFIRDLADCKRIQEILLANRYHLVLALLQGDIQGDFVDRALWVNAINHLADENIIQSCVEDFGENKVPHRPGIVNKSTAYFNVFLEIQKGVSLTAEDSTMKPLQRLDVVNHLNYPIAYLISQSNHQFYVLNYADTLDKQDVSALLAKID